MKKFKYFEIVLTAIIWIFIICLIFIKPFRYFISEIVMQHRFGFVIVLILVILALLYNPLKAKVKKDNAALDNLKDLPAEDLNKLNINLDEFKKDIFALFKDIESYWITENDTKLRFLLSEDVYNEYKEELAVLKFNNYHNIINDIELLDIKVVKLFEEDNKNFINVYLKTNLYDYIVDENNNVIRGFKDKKKEVEFLLTFLIKKHALDKCPYCTAPLKENMSECVYCGRLIDNKNEYVLSKKIELKERKKLNE